MKITTLLALIFLVVSCSKNKVIFEAYPNDAKTNLKATNPNSFNNNATELTKFLTEPEIYNSIAVQYQLGETIGFKEYYFIKPLLKDYKTSDGYRKDLTLRSYDYTNKLMDEIVLSRTDNDTLFAGKVYEDLSIITTINDTEIKYILSEKGKFQKVND